MDLRRSLSVNFICSGVTENFAIRPNSFLTISLALIDFTQAEQRSRAPMDPRSFGVSIGGPLILFERRVAIAYRDVNPVAIFIGIEQREKRIKLLNCRGIIFK